MLEIVNNILYACSGGGLKGYDLNTGNQVLNYNLNASFLNGITHMENTLFITDFSDRKLYTYSIEEESHDEIASFTKNPNGTYWDSMSNRLLVIFWGNNAPIFEIDYTALNKRIDPFKEELMQKCFHPKRLVYYLEKFNYDIGNDEYITT